jgi:hypothetical protein
LAQNPGLREDIDTHLLQTNSPQNQSQIAETNEHMKIGKKTKPLSLTIQRNAGGRAHDQHRSISRPSMKKI